MYIYFKDFIETQIINNEKCDFRNLLFKFIKCLIDSSLIIDFNQLSKKELIDWLGHQPIQKKTNINNTTYALAHAWFDAELYNSDKNFNLEKALQLELYGREDDKTLQKFRTAMWYRKEDERTHYSQVKFPEGCVMVVGHTVQKEGIGVKNFTNDKSYKPVIYIDTGKNTSALDLSTGEVLEYQQYDEAR